MNEKKYLNFEEDKKFSSQENATKMQWDKRYSKKEPYRDTTGVPFIREAFEKYKDQLEGKKILDVGCGNGRNLHYFAEQGCDTYGMDISEEALKQLKKDLNEEGLSAEVQKGSFYNLPYQDNNFECVVSNNVFQHNDWEGAQKSIAEASRVLKDDGLFFLSVRSTSRELPFNRKNIPDRGITHIPGEGTKAGIKLHHYSLDEIEELARQNSLEILEKEEIIKEVKKEKGIEKKGHWQVVFKKITEDKK